MNDVRAREVGNLLDGALDEHLEAGVEVGNIGLQGLDVLADDFNMFHGKILCKTGQTHRCPKSRKREMSSMGVVVAEATFSVTE